MSSDAEASKNETYYRESCGGAEFFARYGANIVKPALALALSRADLRPGMSALDAGCGRGELLFQLRERGVHAVGADYSAAALGLAKTISRGHVLRADASRLPFKDRQFDRLFFLGVVDHLSDAQLLRAFDEFRRVLKPGGVVLLTTCVNTDYYKRLTYGARRSAARAMGLPEPRAPKSAEDEVLHVNEHNEKGLRSLLEAAGWDHEIEARANDKYAVDELYGSPLPQDFPLKRPGALKRAWHRAVFRGPWKRYLARELFCRAWPKKG